MSSLVLVFYFWKTLFDKLILLSANEICPHVDQALAPTGNLLHALIMFIPEGVPSLDVGLTF